MTDVIERNAIKRLLKSRDTRIAELESALRDLFEWECGPREDVFLEHYPEHAETIK